ncbi:MAG TPA: flagellar hook basal-body protein [Planctomycetota bacterium]|nr:flagellar hook basal-body protein [Planctomycetota bacterium]
MDHGLYRAAGAMAAAGRTLDRVADDLANVGTHGHKRRVVTQEFVEVLTAHGVQQASAPRVQTDFSQGDLQMTGAPLHLAIEGAGFFAVESPEGELLTRNGAFQMTETGAVVDGNGWPVAFQGGAGALDPTGETPVVDGYGVVHQGPREVGRLSVVDFGTPERLEEVGRGMWRATREAGERPAAGRVRQGALERSNANAVEGLIELIANQRAYELASSTLQQIDQSYRRLHQPR